MKRFVNYRIHLCGCKTRFDVIAWHSDLYAPCADHDRR